jgi:fucose permease
MTVDRRAPGNIHLCVPRYRVCFSPSGRFTQVDSLTRSLELVVWLVPSLIGGAVAVSLVGVLLGPIYPIVMNESRRILPRWLLTGCIGWIAGLGQTGSAALPFMTGAIASKTGIKSLHPL